MDTNYIVHLDGRVYSNKSRKYLKPGMMTSGYRYVNLRINGKSVSHSIHRLVAQKFLDNPENKPQVNHKDGNKLNNHVSNLEWVTVSENSKHAYNNGLTPPPPTREGQFGYDHNRSIEVHEYNSETGKYIRSFGSMSEASRHYGYHVSTISVAIRNGNKCRNKRYYSKTHVELYKP